MYIKDVIWHPFFVRDFLMGYNFMIIEKVGGNLSRKLPSNQAYQIQHNKIKTIKPFSNP
jgi:hypothetical protein